MKARSNSLDAEPFRQILYDRLDIIERNLAGKQEAISGKTILAQEAGVHPRRLFGIMQGQRTITFDMADLIVTRILGPMAWFEREDLSEIYMSFDLRRLDYGKPVNDVIRQKNKAEVQKAVETHGGYRKAARAMGLPESVLQHVLARSPDYTNSATRFYKPTCINGHDKTVTGVTKSGHCKQCRSDGARRRREHEKEYMRRLRNEVA